MGLLRDLIERRHQDARDQAFREFDTYKSILGDTRPVEQGGFSDEQKSDALNRIVGMAAPSQKHAKAVMPIFQHLLGIGGGGGKGTNDPMAAAPQAGSQSGSVGGSAGGSAPSASPASPATLAGITGGMGSVDESSIMGGGGGGNGGFTPANYTPITPPATSSPSPAAQPAAQPAQAPSPRPQPQPPIMSAQNPTRPLPTPQANPQANGRGGVFAFPTLQERLQRQRDVAVGTAQNQVAAQEAILPAQIRMGQQQFEAQQARYQQLIQQGFTPAMAALQAGFKPPTGAFSAESRPVPGASYVQRTMPDGTKQVGYYAGGQWHQAEGAELPTRGNTNTPTEQNRTDLLAAYAAEKGKTVDQLTPQERVEATSSDTAALRTLQGTIRAQHPDWSPDQIKAEAGKMYQKQFDNNQKKVEVQIQTGENNLRNNTPLNMGGVGRTPGMDPVSRDEQFLSTRPIGEQTQIKQLANYELQVTPYMLTRSGRWADLAALAKIYDPSFDASQYQVRQRAKLAFTSGKEAQNIRSLNTVIGHMGTLEQLSQDLNNHNVQGVNRMINFVRTQLGHPEVNNFNMAADAVIDEMANLFKQSGVTDQSVNQWKAHIGNVQSPAQMEQAIQTGLELMGSRTAALSGQWHNPMAMGDTPFQFLSPRSLQVLTGLGVDPTQLGLLPQDFPKQANGQSNGGAQGGGNQPIQQFSSGGYSYVERRDIPPQVINSIQEDGQLHEIRNGNTKFYVKKYQGRVYQVEKQGNGGGNGGGRGGR